MNNVQLPLILAIEWLRNWLQSGKIYSTDPVIQTIASSKKGTIHEDLDLELRTFPQPKMR